MPNGVNNLLQFLIDSSNSPIIRMQESKVDVQSYVLLSFIYPLAYIIMLNLAQRYKINSDFLLLFYLKMILKV